jgi:histidinol-phosphate aminotransferase
VRSGGAPKPTPEVERLQPYTVPSAGRRGFLRLDFNENLLGPSPRVLERLRGIDPDDIALYPDETAARAAVARHFGLDSALDLVLTSGVDEGIRLVCDAFLRPGDSMVMLEPGYAMYRFYATLAGGRVAPVSYGEDLTFPDRALRDQVKRDCRVLIIGDPNNPTGTPVPAGIIEDLARACPASVILADEAYADFAESSSRPLLARHPNLIVARTFSKAYGLAGLRAGVLLGHRETLGWIARMRSPYAVNSMALAALAAALEDEAYVRRYVEEVRAARRTLVEGLKGIGIETYPSSANFLIARIGESSSELRRALKSRGVLVRDRSDHPLLRGTLRIGIGTREQVAACLEGITEALHEVRGETP